MVHGLPSARDDCSIPAVGSRCANKVPRETAKLEMRLSGTRLDAAPRLF
jgi:hypothetical protein